MQHACTKHGISCSRPPVLSSSLHHLSLRIHQSHPHYYSTIVRGQPVHFSAIVFPILTTPRVMAGLLRTISRPLWRQQGATRARHGVPGLSIRTSPRVRPFSSASEDLEKAKARLSVLTEDPGNDVKLKLYGLYKQVRRASLGSGWLSIANTPIPLVSSLPAFLLLRPPRRPPLVGALPSSLECSTWLGEQSGMLGTALGICHRFMSRCIWSALVYTMQDSMPCLGVHQF